MGFCGKGMLCVYVCVCFLGVGEGMVQGLGYALDLLECPKISRMSVMAFTDLLKISGHPSKRQMTPTPN